MSSVTVKFRGIPILEEILDKMMEYGIAETKSEAIQRGDIELRNRNGITPRTGTNKISVFV